MSKKYLGFGLIGIMLLGLGVHSFLLDEKYIYPIGGAGITRVDRDTVVVRADGNAYKQLEGFNELVKTISIEQDHVNNGGILPDGSDEFVQREAIEIGHKELTNSERLRMARVSLINKIYRWALSSLSPLYQIDRKTAKTLSRIVSGYYLVTDSINAENIQFTNIEQLVKLGFVEFKNVRYYDLFISDCIKCKKSKCYKCATNICLCSMCHNLSNKFGMNRPISIAILRSPKDGRIHKIIDQNKTILVFISDELYDKECYNMIANRVQGKYLNHLLTVFESINLNNIKKATYIYPSLILTIIIIFFIFFT